ncbi:unnamed protein product [Brachionus calyciflorus]|uniref:EF-hand domain-containing protein n=1 Tax=Brachionus calyciflorus TaxID=104777 RepID=A0A813Q454_9BILA|nr:unnamed protein product [Brachionus calyciflorus]
MKSKKKSIKLNPIPDHYFSSYDYETDLAELDHIKNSFELPQLDFGELTKRFENIKHKIDLDKLNTLIKSSFNSFDPQQKGEIDAQDLKNCIYTMNLCPSKSQFQDICKQLNINLDKKTKKVKADNNQSVKISFEDFTRTILPLIISGKCSFKSENLLQKSFKILSDNKNYIEWKFLEDLLSSNGEKFKTEELELMKDHIEQFTIKDKFYFDNYIANITSTFDHETIFKNSIHYNQNSIILSKNL